MAVPITPEIEQLVESLYQSGGFDDRTQVLDEALRLLQRRRDIARKVQEGIEDLDAGYFTEYDESELERFRSDVGIINSDPTVSGK
jgi:Arc/MetJ-type ribon-helix-helix transcriptional regulator